MLPSNKQHTMSWYPLTFEPVYKDYIWGGDRIATRYARITAPERCAESWECSSRPEGTSVVREGPLAGKTLTELVRAEGCELLGAGGGADFPLLVKIIDARQRLSVQVHPSESSAATVGGEPKTEAWHILAAEPGSRLYCGFRQGVTREQVSQATTAKDPAEILSLLRAHPVKTGDAIFVPGGRVHAIGAGIMLLEVQQNSNTTFRLYDWNRTGNDGKPRPLHVNKALAAIDWADRGSSVAKRPPPAKPGIFQLRISCRWFLMEEVRLAKKLEIDKEGAGFHIIFAVNGGLAVAGGGIKTAVPAGSTALMPAAMKRYSLQPDGVTGSETHAVRIRIPPAPPRSRPRRPRPDHPGVCRV